MRFHLKFWLGFAGLFILLLFVFWKSLIAAVVISCFVLPSYFLLSLGLSSLYARFGFKRVSDRRALLGIFLLCLASAGLVSLVAEVALMSVHYLGVEVRGESRLWTRMIFHFGTFIIWSCLHLWVQADLVAKAEAARRYKATLVAERAELQMLRFQLNPHFLFNSLNTVITEIQENPKMALEITHRLADYLRFTLEYRDEMLVPLVHELKGMKKYLEIEEDRFGDNLRVRFDPVEEVPDRKVPAFILQPLIENAVKHGMNTSDPPWDLVVKVRALEGDGLVMAVRSTGELREEVEKDDQRSGVGLEIIKRRLALHYPDRNSFTLAQDGESVVATIELEGEAC